MRKITPTELRNDLYRILDDVLETGEGIEVTREAGSVVLLPQRNGKLARLKNRQTVVGDPNDLDQIGFEGAWQPDSF